ncbi:sensor histidine kinase [Nocardioides limicola]|uniref:sensor histidine kinase n=1 Tax=Nocardioides limicola TaxID=2803368 RepID=UPI00193C062D|nr:sensor histidine kinase [Nocardioides sp. DJM-14]
MSWPVGRMVARGMVLACAGIYLGGLLLWARDGQSVVALWLLPDSWSDQGLERAAAELGVPLSTVTAYFMALTVAPAAVGLVAALLVLRGATEWFRCYLAVALALFGTLNSAIPTVYDEVAGGVLGQAVAGLQGVAWVGLFALVYVFPDGRFVPRWTRWAVVAWAAYLPYSWLIAQWGFSDQDSPAAVVPLVLLWATAAYAAVHRYWKADPEQRRQLRGVVAALVLWLTYIAVLLGSPLLALTAEVGARGLLVGAATALVSHAIVTLVPAAVAVAVLRYRLYDVDVWVNRALVYGLLTGLVVLVYGMVAALGGVVWPGDSQASAVLAVIVVAVVFHPLRLRVQRTVDRVVYGRRREPYAVLTALGRQFESVLPPDRVLATLVRQVGTVLRLPYAAASHSATTVVHPPGAEMPPGRREVFPLRSGEEVFGELTVVAARGDGLRAADRDLLDTLARRAGAAVKAASLNDELRRSRERILVAREDERRRLQRDLHDGLAPTLASLYQRVDTARSLLDRDPSAAARLLDDVGTQTRAVIDQIRDLVRALHPPELDELGLAGAVEAAAGRFPNLMVRVVADPVTVPAVTEIAAYRIATEALTNVARHAGAQAATVRIEASDHHLSVTVTDDGCGVSATAEAGTGLRSMRERADDLGGSCRVSRLPGGGTRVHAVLPWGLAG